MTRLLKSSAILAGFLFFLMNHTALGCDVDLEIVVEDAANQAAFNDTGELGTGSNVKFKLSSHAHCYAAVFWKDVQGQVFNLTSLTSKNQPSIEMAVDETKIIPDSWLTLDEKPGLETIYLISSGTPLTGLSQIGLLLANDDPQEIKARLSAKDLRVKWETIEHTVDARIEKLFLPPRSQQLALNLKSIEIDVIPRKPTISPTHHTRHLKELSIGSKTAVRGASSSLIRQAEKAVVYIFHEGAIGSGVVVNKSNGLIVTNEHVVKGFDEVGVIFSADSNSVIRDQRTYVADVVKVVTEHDLALVRLRNSPKNMLAFPLGNASNVSQGMTVHAIGHPEGLLWTYTKGYVSQIRLLHVWGEGRSADVIQTQTPINAGNSGGPLFTDRGQLIGVNTAGAEESEGLNISVSVAHVKELLGMSESKTPTDKFGLLSIPSLAKEHHDLNENGVPDLFCFDTDQNGKPDVCLFDEDEDGKGDYWRLDFNENRRFDGEIHKHDGGYGYVWFFDRDEDDVPELMGYDLDSDGKVDFYRPYSD